MYAYMIHACTYKYFVHRMHGSLQIYLAQLISLSQLLCSEWATTRDTHAILTSPYPQSTSINSRFQLSWPGNSSLIWTVYDMQCRPKPPAMYMYCSYILNRWIQLKRHCTCMLHVYEHAHMCIHGGTYMLAIESRVIITFVCLRT